jgi:tripartite-type tricarboxylate transporter receptor subunit TctC
MHAPPQIPHIKSGRVRALAVTSKTRSKAMPDLPTLDEVGLKGYEVTAWFGLAAPAKTPREIVMRLNQAQNRATASPEVRDVMSERGADLIQGTPEQFQAYVKAEIDKWGPVVKRAGVTAE